VTDWAEKQANHLFAVLGAADALVDEIGKGGPKGNYDAHEVTEKLRLLVRAVLASRKGRAAELKKGKARRR